MGVILGPKMDQKSKKSGIENKSDFKTKLESRPGAKRPRPVALEPPLAHPHMRAWSIKKTIRPKTQAPKTKNQEPKVDRLIDSLGDWLIDWLVD